MKILIVSGTFPPRKFGGVTASSFKLASSLKQRGHEVTVYTTDTGNNEKNRLDVRYHQKIDDLDVYYFKNYSNKLAFKYRFYLPIGLFSQLKKQIKNFHLIAIQDFRSLLSIFIHHIAKKNNIPYVIQARGSLPYDEGNFLFKKIFDIIWGRRILKDTAGVIALSKVEAEQYYTFGVEKRKISIIYNGLDLSDYQTLPLKGTFFKKCNLNPDEKIILSLGRLNKIKGIDLLITSFSKVYDQVKDIRLIIAGPDDGELSNLKRLVDELEIGSHVFFVGPLYGPEKISAFTDANIFVLPSRYEVFGNTVIESLACATPVIVTKGCHIGELIESSGTGIVIDNKEEELANAIITLVTDKNLAINFGQKGRDLVFNQFGQDVIINRVEQMYRDCISANKVLMMQANIKDK